ncbi:MAG: hypothetical protein LBJ43_00555 [Propionibacteriaceae bacterium]|jgi:hypothetical protein|nr:hypothetical protein [Propionibacteriaceae bacterium]
MKIESLQKTRQGVPVVRARQKSTGHILTISTALLRIFPDQYEELHNVPALNKRGDPLPMKRFSKPSKFYPETTISPVANLATGNKKSEETIK